MVSSPVGWARLECSGTRAAWLADERTGRLVDGRSGASLGIGDVVTVLIQRVDLASRHLDLQITKLAKRTAAPAKVARRKTDVPDRGRGKRKGYKQGRRGRKGK